MKVSVVIPYQPTSSRRAEIWSWVRARWELGAGTLADQVECIVAGGPGDEPVHRGRVRNWGVEQAVGDVLVIADADTIPDFDLLAEAIAALDDHPWVLPYDVYFNVNREHSDRILAGTHPPTVTDQYDHRITDAVSGMLVMPRTAFHDAGGYDERFDGWGYEDTAFAVALDTMAGPHYRIHGDILHLWHEAPEDQCFGQPHIEANRRLFKQYKRAGGDRTKMGALVERVPQAG